MARQGLTFDQGPAFGAPMRLFLAAPLFVMLAAAASLLLLEDWLAGRWSGASMALTHLITLGYLGTVMQGALLQMLPVVLGSPVPGARLLSWLGLVGLGAGAPMLALGILLGEPVCLMAAMVLLALAWLPFLGGLALALTRTLAGGEMAWPIRLAALALVATALSGLFMAGSLAGLWPLPEMFATVGLHAAWGLFGWVEILIVGVAYQVIPMLQLTPAYGRWLRRALAWLLPASMLVFSLAMLFDEAIWVGAAACVFGVGASLAFALATLHLLGQRRRKLPDVTLDFWRLSMVALAVSALLFGLLDVLPESRHDAAELSLGLVFLLGFAASAVNGMLYKIVPFLAWFHLQSQTGASAGTIPNMREMMSESRMRRHFRLHLAAVCLIAPSPFLWPWLASLGLVAEAAGAHLLWLNLQVALAAFRAHGGRL
jgi:hypothetical protein